MLATLTSTPGSLFENFERLQRELDPFFDLSGASSIRAVTRGSFPAINIGVTPDTVELYALLPGVRKEDLDLSIQQNVLTLSGKRETPGGSGGNGGNEGARTYLRERFTGSFQRSVTLPTDVDAEQVSANLENGILHISVRRRESARQRRISVN